jgi:hypothetical protein
LIRELFEEVATVDALICGELELKSEPKELIYYYAYTNVANRIVKFCMNKVFKCREWRVMR